MYSGWKKIVKTGSDKIYGGSVLSRAELSFTCILGPIIEEGIFRWFPSQLDSVFGFHILFGFQILFNATWLFGHTAEECILGRSLGQMIQGIFYRLILLVLCLSANYTIDDDITGGIIVHCLWNTWIFIRGNASLKRFRRLQFEREYNMLCRLGLDKTRDDLSFITKTPSYRNSRIIIITTSPRCHGPFLGFPRRVGFILDWNKSSTLD